VGLFRGFLAPFRGAIYIARERMWKHIVAPVLLNMGLGLGTMIAALRFFRKELGALLDTAPVLGGISLFFMTGLGGVLLFILLQPLLNAIFCDRLAEAVEKRVRGEAPRERLLPSIGKAIVHGLLKLVLYALALGIGAVTTIGTIGIGAVVGVGLGAIFLAYDGFDYPLARRGASFGGKWAYLAKNPGLAVGYGLGSYVLYLVPLAFLVAPPFAAVGATLAYLEADTRAAGRGAKTTSREDAAKATKTDTKAGVQDVKSDRNSDQKPVSEAHNPIDISAS
jgi:CysZ protein